MTLVSWTTAVTLIRTSRLSGLRVKVSEHIKLLRENDTNCIYFYIKVLAFQGFWSLEPAPRTATRQEHIVYFLRYWNSRLLIAFSVYLTLLTCPMSAWTNVNDALIAVIEPLGFMFVTCLVGMSAASLIYNTKSFKKAVRAMEKMNRLGSLQAERPQEVLDYMHRVSKRTLNYFLCAVTIIVVVCIAQFPDMYVKRLLFFKAWHPFDSLATPYFQITLLGMTANALTGYGLAFCLNALVMAMLGQAIGQLKLLNHNLRNIRRINSELQAAKKDQEKRLKGRFWNKSKHPHITRWREQSRGVPNYKVADETGGKQHRQNQEVNKKIDDQIKVLLRRSVRHHQSIISFVKKLVGAFDLILVQQYNLCIGPSILTVTIVTFSKEYDMKTLVFALLVFGSILDLAIFCWLSDQVVHQSDQVREAVFSCDWLDASEGFKCHMRIIMSRSNQPLTVRLLGFIPLNMEKFTQVLKMAYSYYMSIVASYERRLGEAQLMEAFNFEGQN